MPKNQTANFSPLKNIIKTTKGKIDILWLLKSWYQIECSENFLNVPIKYLYLLLSMCWNFSGSIKDSTYI